MKRLKRVDTGRHTMADVHEPELTPLEAMFVTFATMISVSFILITALFFAGLAHL